MRDIIALLTAMQSECVKKNDEKTLSVLCEVKSTVINQYTELKNIVTRLESYSRDREVDNDFWEITESLRKLSN